MVVVSFIERLRDRVNMISSVNNNVARVQLNSNKRNSSSCYSSSSNTSRNGSNRRVIRSAMNSSPGQYSSSNHGRYEEENVGARTTANSSSSQTRTSGGKRSNNTGSVITKTTRELASKLASRDKNVVLLVETTNCRYCEQVEPTFAAMAAMFAGDESIEVQRVVCKTPEQKAFAGKYFRARSFPTICTLPKGAGPLFRHASSDRSIGAILEFTRETTGAVPNYGRSERYVDDLDRRNDWLRQIQQGGLESTTSMAGSYESSLRNGSTAGAQQRRGNNNYGGEYAARANFLRQQQEQEQEQEQEQQQRSSALAPPSSASSLSQSRFEEPSAYRSNYGNIISRAAEEERYFGQLALDPKDDVAFDSLRFQSQRNYNYGGEDGGYYNNQNNRVQITDVFSQASRNTVENVKRVHKGVTAIVAELPSTAARIAQTDIVPAFALGLVLSAILSSFGNLVQSIRRDRYRRYEKMQRSGKRTLSEREEALVEIEREFSEMALAEWRSATKEEMLEIPKQFWILCNAYAAIVFRIWEVRINEAIVSCGKSLKSMLGLRRDDQYYDEYYDEEDEEFYSYDEEQRGEGNEILGYSPPENDRRSYIDEAEY